MSSFKEMRDLLLLGHGSNLIDDLEFLLLHDEYQSKNPDFRHENHTRFSLETMDEADCLAEFRFEKRHITLLAEVLRIPETFVCYQRSIASGVEGLCMLLRRLAYPCLIPELKIMKYP